MTSMTKDKIISLKSLLNNDNEECFDQTITHEYKNIVDDLLKNSTKKQIVHSLISDINFYERKDSTLTSFQRNVREGDLVIIDFGKQYRYECSYVHPALVVAKMNNKVMVVPMSSNDKMLEKALYLKKDNLCPLLSSGEKNIDKHSTLILNDAKWIAPTRVLQQIGTIDTNSTEFKIIKQKLIDIIFGKEH